MKLLNNEILITGGTGSLGKTLIKKLLRDHNVGGIRVYSRDEFKQWQFKKELEELNLNQKVAFLVGDVRDRNRLELAAKKVDIIIHAAAMKQVPAFEYNPLEAIKTNVDGAKNIINAALKNKVDKVLNISTDKAVYPINLYGMSKGVAEKLFAHANVYSGNDLPSFASCRYGNVLNSRGSILPLFKKQIKSGTVTLTHPDMTRFFITLNEVAEFVIKRVSDFWRGGEIFVPKMKSIEILKLIKLISSKTKIEIIGIRPGEKIHECLIAKEENVYDKNDHFVIMNNNYSNNNLNPQFSIKCEKDFIYTSCNAERFKDKEFLEKIKKYW